VNALAYSRAGVTESTSDPPGGRFDRDPKTGKLNVRISERASEVFDKAIGATYSRADYRDGVKLISKMMSRAGITSAHDASGVHEYLRGYQDTHDDADLSVRIYCFIHYSEIDRMLAAGIDTGFGDEWVRVGGMKMDADGSISERTAWLSRPYVGRPSDFGTQVMTEQEPYENGRKGT